MFSSLFKLPKAMPIVLNQARRSYKKTIEQFANQNPGALKNSRVLVRVDFNVPLSKKDHTVITDDTRIREALPTINFLRKAGAKVMLASHCGRPDGKVNEKMRMAPMAKRLSELIKDDVLVATDCIGPDVDAASDKLKSGGVLMLENTRFHASEEKNDAEFAKKLAKNADIYVNDAFGTAHRAHASTEGVAKFVKTKVAGFLLEKEIRYLKSAVDSPKRPFAAIVGGAKVSTKIPVIKSLLSKCDKIFIGGGMIFTFYKAQGMNVGKSMVEEEFVPLAKSLLDEAKAKNVKIFLPTDVVVADEFKADAKFKTVAANAIPDGWMGLDIGQDSLDMFGKELSSCKTVVWNGPMGVFEFDNFAKGTLGIAQALADVTSRGGITIIGGGDSVAAVAKAKLEDKMSHISTGGGASLEMLEGLELPGVSALDNA
jgi:phosphoglycerate kinase